MDQVTQGCPCGSGSEYSVCCEPLVRGAVQAETAEQLMRSRYSAYVKVETDYIFDTTHPDHREGYDHDGTREWAESAEWLGLEIVTTRGGGADDAGAEDADEEAGAVVATGAAVGAGVLQPTMSASTRTINRVNHTCFIFLLLLKCDVQRWRRARQDQESLHPTTSSVNNDVMAFPDEG